MLLTQLHRGHMQRVTTHTHARPKNLCTPAVNVAGQAHKQKEQTHHLGLHDRATPSCAVCAVRVQREYDWVDLLVDDAS
jgi:hypothetical protein